MSATGIDIGGTKILAQHFGAGWSVLDERRVDTPDDYSAMLQVLDDLARWAPRGPMGVATAGVQDPATGILHAANLASDGQSFAQDLALKLGRAVPVLNDARALALSEAVLGAGRGYDRVLALSLGTGLGGGVVANGALLPGQERYGGEFGHMSLPVRIDPQLPRFTCGCGRLGCVETLISGTGLSRLAAHFGEGVKDRGQAWTSWVDVIALVLADLSLAFDPEVVVLGGGAAQADGLLEALRAVLPDAMLPGVPAPALAVSDGGTPARGAAYFAMTSRQTA